MNARRSLVLLLLALVAAGCTGGGDDADGDGGPPAPQTGLAPWWAVGEHWTVDIERPDGSKETFKLVNFWNDSDTSHFWLGVADRAQALDMAIHDDMPLLGRIHWNILTPHERGIHAHGMYTFPVDVGEQFGGLAFGREWSIDVTNGTQPGQFLFEGISTDRATIRYDFLPANGWFSFVEVEDRSGARQLRLDVTDHGHGAKGQHFFLRGRDYHTLEDPGGAGEQTFEVAKEEIAHKSLAVELLGDASGPLTVTFLDAKGALKHTEPLTSGKVQKLVEIPGPIEVGTWTIRYAGTGTLAGTIEVVGILEYTRTI